MKIGGGLLIAVAALIALRGHYEIAVPMVMVGLGMYGKDLLPPGALGKFGKATEGEHPRSQVPVAKGNMSRAEALQVLGLVGNPTENEIRETHKKLLKDFHPDKGGSDYLASKINQAKDVLLKSG